MLKSDLVIYLVGESCSIYLHYVVGISKFIFSKHKATTFPSPLPSPSPPPRVISVALKIFLTLPI